MKPGLGAGEGNRSLAYRAHQSCELSLTKATVTPEVTLHALAVDTALFVHTISTLRYEHDPKNLAANVAGHGVWFHEANDFDWESAVVNVDSRRARSESRLAAVGYIGDLTCT